MNRDAKKNVMSVDFWFLLSVLFLMPIAGIYNFMGKPVQIADILFMIYFLIWFPKRVFSGGFRFDAKLLIFLGLFFVFCASAYFSPFRARSLVGLSIKAYLLCLAYVISEEVDSFVKLKMAVNAILLSGLYVLAAAFLGIGSFLAGGSSIFLCPAGILDLPMHFLPRVQSVFSSPSFLSSFVIIVILLLLERLMRKTRRVFYIAYLVGSAVVLFFTFSRDIIGLGWGLIFLFTHTGVKGPFSRAVLNYSKPAMAFITVCILLMSVWYIFPVTVYKDNGGNVPAADIEYKLEGGAIISSMGWIKERHISFNSKLHNRFMELRDAGYTFLKYPLFGIGAGVLPSKGYFTDPYSRSAHNTYLQVLAQTGIIGFSVFVFFITSLFRALRVSSGRLSGSALILKAILVIFLINMFFIDLDNFRYFWIIAGLALSLKRIKVNDHA